MHNIVRIQLGLQHYAMCPYFFLRIFRGPNMHSLVSYCENLCSIWYMHYKTSTWPWRRIPAPALPCAGALALSPCPPQAMSSSTRSAVSSLHLGHSRRCCIHPLVPADAPPLKSFISTPVLRLVALPSQPLPSESGLRPPQYKEAY